MISQHRQPARVIHSNGIRQGARSRRLLLACLALSLAVTFLPAKEDAPQSPLELQPDGTEQLIGQRAPAWELKDPDGKPVRSADFHGKIVLVAFWGTWCPPCLKEVPILIDLQKTYAKDLAVVGLAVDEDSPKALKRFVKRNGLNYPVAMVDAETKKRFNDPYYLPTVFLIDREGVVRYRHRLFAKKEVYEEEIRALLGK